MATTDVNASRIAILGFLGIIVILTIILLLEVVFYQVQAREHWIKDVNQPSVELSNLLHDQQVRLETYRWIDQKKKIVAIPIDRAINLVVDERSSWQPDQGGTP